MSSSSVFVRNNVKMQRYQLISNGSFFIFVWKKENEPLSIPLTFFLSATTSIPVAFWERFHNWHTHTHGRHWCGKLVKPNGVFNIWTNPFMESNGKCLSKCKSNGDWRRARERERAAYKQEINGINIIKTQTFIVVIRSIACIIDASIQMRVFSLSLSLVARFNAPD